MPGRGLIELAQWAGQTVVAAAVTDVWASARRKFARLFGRGDRRRTEAAERWLAETHEVLAAAEGTELESVRAHQAQRWQGRFADLLDEDPDVEADLRTLLEEVRAQLPTKMVTAADHSVAAGRDVAITISGGGIAAGVVHGNITPPDPAR